MGRLLPVRLLHVERCAAGHPLMILVADIRK
jgi:hypothetical protein